MGSGKTTVGPLRRRAPRLALRRCRRRDRSRGRHAPSPSSSPATAKPPSATANTRPSPASPPPTRWCWPSAAAPSSDPTPATCCSPLPARCSSISKWSWPPPSPAAAAPKTRGPILADQANLATRYQRRLPLYRTAHVSIPVGRTHPGAGGRCDSAAPRGCANNRDLTRLPALPACYHRNRRIGARPAPAAEVFHRSHDSRFPGRSSGRSCRAAR